MTNKNFNITLSKDMISQAYQNNNSYNSYCFLVGPNTSSQLPEGFKIIEAKLENGHLKIRYNNDTEYDNCYFYIENGKLYVKFYKGGIVMSLVDLGNVMGPTGATGPQGPQGAKGDDGITPSFVLGDGTGGTTAGHLYVDYDNPYTPTSP